MGIGNERSRNEVSQQTFNDHKTIISESTRPCLDVDRCEAADHQATYTLSKQQPYVLMSRSLVPDARRFSLETSRWDFQEAGRSLHSDCLM